MHPIVIRALAAERIREWQREAAVDRARRQARTRTARTRTARTRTARTRTARTRTARARAARRGCSPAGRAAAAGPAAAPAPVAPGPPGRLAWAGRAVRVAWRVAAVCAVAVAGAVLRAVSSPLTRRVARVLADIRLAQRTAAIRRACLDQHLAAPHRAPADYLEFLARTGGPLLHEPPAAARRRGQRVR